MNLITDNNGFSNIYSDSLKVNNNPLKLWVHESIGIQNSKNRTIRMSILKIHSEIECLKNIFRSIHTNVIDVQRYSDESESLQVYFSRASNSFLNGRDELRQLNNKTSFVDSFAQIYSEFHPSELKDIIDKIKNFDLRHNVEYKAIKTLNIIHMNMETNNYTANASNVGSMGNNANTESSTFNLQNNLPPTNINFEKLIEELTLLKTELKSIAETPEQLESLTNIAKAREAAVAKDGSKVIEHLKSAGSWALEAATKIGVGVMTEFIKHQAGL